MKKFVGIVAALFMTLNMAAQSQNLDDTKIALQGYSPVSYLDMGLAQRGLKEFKSEYQGAKYYFTSKDQKKKFDANPTKYVPQYGGYCAFGVSVGGKFRVDPNKFVVHNNKLYLFLNDVEVDALQLFKDSNANQTIAKADKNWKTLKTK
ncbi:YHS domain-containing (seleno)protein [Leptobacterium flavescens]|nr:YHS domain-containing (seleno)protein [Leptobacterium flavescens]